MRGYYGGQDRAEGEPVEEDLTSERFLVLARNGVTVDNLVWKDTVLLRTGDVVDILLDTSNPGLWMAHCHIAEHMESEMLFNFRVRPSP